MGYEQTAYLMELARVPMFSSCSESQLERIAALSEAHSAAPGEAIIEQGADADAFFVLMEGEAAVERDGREVAALGAGDYFGELSLFDAGPRSATVSARGECVLAVINRDRFAVALDEIHEIRDALLRGMARRLHEVDSRLASRG